ncbi:peptide deformylase [Solidesulfovibrio sp.]|uniref:peptide deformylase n=1 Tax=Solidesulfovibrio sp. TaxID=2910990 RepID=UPI002B1F39A3|nr:peptide deformylase [Solidesulfovibrio sp.]MEA4857452.1 peptide deformylase [Solidesulfovibrio sp.]
MPLEILKYPHPILARQAVPVAAVTPEVRELASAMAEAMYANQGIGLAAPQVGHSIRLIVIDLSGPDKREGLMTLVNPVITAASGEQEDEEGCLSVREYRTNVRRAANVTVKALDLDGKAMEIEADGLLAVCLQHEIDHLSGVLFIDRISRLKRAMYDKRVKRWTRQRETADQTS